MHTDLFHGRQQPFIHSQSDPAGRLSCGGAYLAAACAHTHSSSLTHVSLPAGYLSRSLSATTSSSPPPKHSCTLEVRSGSRLWKGPLPLLEEHWVCPSQGNSGGSFLPLRWMEGKRRQAKEGGGEGRREELGARQREGKRHRGARPGGGGRPRFKQIGAGIGGRLLARPGPRELGPPTHGPGNSLAHRLGRAGQGQAGTVPGHVNSPPVEGPDSPVGGQAGSSEGLGGSRAREKSPGPACLPLPHLLGRLSVTRGGRGGPGGGRLLIGPDSARPEGRAQGRAARFRGRKHAQPGLPTLSLGIGQPASIGSPWAGPRPPERHLTSS